MNRWTLSFQQPREGEFLQLYYQSNINYMRLASIVGTVVWLIYGLSDLFWAEAGTMQQVLLLRYAFVLPVLVLGIGVMLLPRLQHLAPYVIMNSITVVSVGVLLINQHTPAEVRVPVEISYFLLVIAGFTFFRLRFVHALTLSALIVAVAMVDAVMSDVPTNRVFFNAVLYVATLLFGGFSCYAMEIYARKNYLNLLRLSERSELAVEASNLRTAQEIARAIAHEFNNPLSIIQTTYDLHVQPCLEGMEDETKRESLLRIPATITRMKALVQQLTRLTSIQRRQYLPGVEMVDLNASSDEKK